MGREGENLTGRAVRSREVGDQSTEARAHTTLPQQPQLQLVDADNLIVRRAVGGGREVNFALRLNDLHVQRHIFPLRLQDPAPPCHRRGRQQTPWSHPLAQVSSPARADQCKEEQRAVDLHDRAFKVGDLRPVGHHCLEGLTRPAGTDDDDKQERAFGPMVGMENLLQELCDGGCGCLAADHDVLARGFRLVVRTGPGRELGEELVELVELVSDDGVGRADHEDHKEFGAHGGGGDVAVPDGSRK
eukprot:754971-Hanusia_phi.AAC.3